MSWTPEQRRRYAPAINDGGSRERDRPSRRHHRRDRPAGADRPTPAVVDADHGPGAVVAVPGGRGLGAAPDSCPPRQTIGSRLERWVRLGVLDRALAVLNACLRLARGRNRRPSAGILDTQSVRTGPQAGPRGYDANKKVKGRKRVLLADTEGLVQALRVVPASVQDRDTPALIEPELAAGSLRQVWADLAFAGERAAAPLARHRIALELVGRKDKTGFAVEPRRWKIEQTFGCLQRYRRLLVDHEGSTAMSRTMTLLAALFMTGAASSGKSQAEFSARLSVPPDAPGGGSKTKS